MKKYTVIVEVGGPGTFWEGHKYTLGHYPFFFLAWLVAKIHLMRFPYRAIEISKVM